MTKNDWVQMRRQQEIAGLAPDKMPITLSPEQIKGMSKIYQQINAPFLRH